MPCILHGCNVPLFWTTDNGRKHKLSSQVLNWGSDVGLKLPPTRKSNLLSATVVLNLLLQCYGTTLSICLSRSTCKLEWSGSPIESIEVACRLDSISLSNRKINMFAVVMFFCNLYVYYMSPTGHTNSITSLRCFRILQIFLDLCRSLIHIYIIYHIYIYHIYISYTYHIYMYIWGVYIYIMYIFNIYINIFNIYIYIH